MSIQSFETLAAAVRTELERIGEHHSCIFAASVLTEVFRRTGYAAAYPLPVGAKILNPACVAWAVKYGWSNDPDSVSRCKAEGGAFTVVGDVPAEAMAPGVWPGHLAVVIPNLFGECHAVCDLTITQASKPELGMNLTPLYFAAPDTFVTGKTEFQIEANGSLILYMAFPRNLSYVETPNWTNRARCLLVADDVIKRLK